MFCHYIQVAFVTHTVLETIDVLFTPFLSGASVPINFCFEFCRPSHHLYHDTWRFLLAAHSCIHSSVALQFRQKSSSPTQSWNCCIFSVWVHRRIEPQLSTLTFSKTLVPGGEQRRKTYLSSTIVTNSSRQSTDCFATVYENRNKTLSKVHLRCFWGVSCYTSGEEQMQSNRKSKCRAAPPPF